MNKSELKQKIQNVVSTAIQHGVNRSISALEEVRAIDTHKMREHYKGTGSKYYDLVTEQIEYTEKQLEPIINEIVNSIGAERT